MSRVYISENARSELIDYLEGEGYDIVPVMPSASVHPAISRHPDIYMCKLGAGTQAEVFHGNPDCLSEKYPGDIMYNAVCMGQYFIHRLSDTSPELLACVKNMPCMTLIDVHQGYTKCNMVVVDEKAAITSDEGIARALSDTDIDLLLISKGHVALPGFDYGFLGGASGRVGNEIVFNGDISMHPNYEKILNFILSRGFKIKYFENWELEDIGSIIEEPVI